MARTKKMRMKPSSGSSIEIGFSSTAAIPSASFPEERQRAPLAYLLHKNEAVDRKGDRIKEKCLAE